MINISIAQFQYTSPQGYFDAKAFKGAFTDYVEKQCTIDLKKKKIPLDVIFNRDKTQKPITRYPLVQFQVRDNEISIVGILQGATLIEIAVKALQTEKSFFVNGHPVNLYLLAVNTQQWLPQIMPFHQVYSLQQWKPFDTQTLKEKADRLQQPLMVNIPRKSVIKPNAYNVLDDMIWGNINRILDDMGIIFSEKPTIYLLQYKETPPQKGYKITWKTYEAVFSTNINLPSYIGLGHETSIGSGKILKVL